MNGRLIALFLILCPLLVSAQVSFEAYTDAKQIVLNSYFEVSFTLKNADGDNFQPPSFDNFDVLEGPSRSLSTTIINNKVSKELSYTYTLQPKRKGKFAIGSASISVNGRIFRTQPLTVEILEGKELSKANPANKVFIKAQLSSDKAIIGQQLSLDYKLYTAVDIDSYTILEESDYQGFFAQDLRRFDIPATREIVNGVQYLTKVLKRVALFPQQAGKLTISPLRLELAAVTDKSERDNGFFFSPPRRTQRLIVQTDEAQVNVQALPPDPPATFTGAVGDFKATYTISRNEATTDDVLSLRLSINGNGDIKRVQPPALVVPDSFEVYDPKVLDESTYESPNGELTGSKEIEYLIQPKKPGTYEIRPAFAYFNPIKSSYVVLDSNVFSLNIQQGAGQPANSIAAENNPAAQEDIRFIKMDTKLHRSGSDFFGSSPFWVLTVLPFFLFGGVIIVKRIQNQHGGISASELKIRRARQEALRHLQVAEKLLNTNESRAFYDEVSKASLGYVCDKLQIPRSALTKDNVRGKLQSLKVEESLIDKFMEIFQTCEIALFSGQDNPAAMNETYQQAVENISKIETMIGK